MPKVHALLVGIDRYRRPELALQGCVNDIVLAERLLRDRIAAADLAVETLCDEQATRAEIIRVFRRHLGAARPGDIALFWFSGHGSTGPLPEEIWYAESAGTCQTTVCHDSRAGAADLYDKELGVLVHEVVATGAQLVTIKDSCHARSGMRGHPATGLTARLAPPADTSPALRDLLPELVRAAADPTRPVPGRQAPGHVALSACDEWEVANESVFPDGVHGVFSAALGRALARLDRDATYRQVLGDTRCQVEGRFRRQVPTLEAVGDLADRVFLGGMLRSRPAWVTLRHVRDDWEVDVGAVHGVLAGSRLAVHGAAPLREVRVVGVHLERSIVEPVAWSPDEEQQYDMVLTDVPLPPVAVSVDASPDVRVRLTEAARTAGPGGGPSPHIRIISRDDEPAARLLLRVGAADDGRALRVTSADHEPLAPPVSTDDHGVVRSVRDLEHIARWLQVRNLANPASRIEDAVRIEVLPAPPDGRRPPRDSAPLPAGNLEFSYTRTGAGWAPPSVFIRLRNTTDAKLFCVLLDLTDRYRMHADLFPGDYVAENWTAETGGGQPVTLSLPPDRPVEPGASVTDWLVLLVAEKRFSSDPFSLPRLREVPRPSARGVQRGLAGVLDRLGLLAVRRDVVPEPGVAFDWGVKVVEVTTRVPRAE
jgi:Caspase domain